MVPGLASSVISAFCASGNRARSARQASGRIQRARTDWAFRRQRRRCRSRGPAALGASRSRSSNKRVDIGRIGQRGFQLMRIEIAVRAFAHAPGHVHVQRQRRQFELIRPARATSACALAAMAQAVLVVSGKLGGGDTQFRQEKIGVVAEAPRRRAAPPGSRPPSCPRQSAGSASTRIAHQNQHAAIARAGAAAGYAGLSACEQLRIIGRVVALHARIARRENPGAPPSASTSSPESSAIAASPLAGCGMPRLQAVALAGSVLPVSSGEGSADVAQLVRSNGRPRQQGAKFAQFAGVRAGDAPAALTGARGR